eukprot:TRINITY_DN56707_c0_g1_i1.p1 TRINITY_DN56707_c0_g1~~TRINITY_DN56707_c0_g1_i1.p1  ORF type:complete len:486 (-),score=108.96 TRINITY_DN56707_c0_g1_i1:674-1963(-)
MVPSEMRFAARAAARAAGGSKADQEEAARAVKDEGPAMDPEERRQAIAEALLKPLHALLRACLLPWLTRVADDRRGRLLRARGASQLLRQRTFQCLRVTLAAWRGSSLASGAAKEERLVASTAFRVARFAGGLDFEHELTGTSPPTSPKRDAEMAESATDMLHAGDDELSRARTRSQEPRRGLAALPTRRRSGSFGSRLAVVVERTVRSNNDDTLVTKHFYAWKSHILHIAMGTMARTTNMRLVQVGGSLGIANLARNNEPDSGIDVFLGQATERAEMVDDGRSRTRPRESAEGAHDLTGRAMEKTQAEDDDRRRSRNFETLQRFLRVTTLRLYFAAWCRMRQSPSEATAPATSTPPRAGAAAEPPPARGRRDSLGPRLWIVERIVRNGRDALLMKTFYVWKNFIVQTAMSIMRLVQVGGSLGITNIER